MTGPRILIVEDEMLIAHTLADRLRELGYEVVAGVRLRLHDAIQETQAKIVADNAADWPVALGHGPWIEEIWVHYLDHALKNSSRPARVVLGASAEANGMVRFWVQDNGRGLQSACLAELFDPVPAGSCRQGMGLFLVRRLVEALGGQAWAETSGAPGRGSVLAFTLPAAGM